jgi:hypothetical protein
MLNFLVRFVGIVCLTCGACVAAAPIDAYECFDAPPIGFESIRQDFEHFNQRLGEMGGRFCRERNPSFYDRFGRRASIYFNDGPLSGEMNTSPHRFIVVVNSSTGPVELVHEFIHLRDAYSPQLRELSESLPLDAAPYIRKWIVFGQTEENAYWQGTLPYRRAQGRMWEVSHGEEFLYAYTWSAFKNLGQLLLSPTLQHLWGLLWSLAILTFSFIVPITAALLISRVIENLIKRKRSQTCS